MVQVEHMPMTAVRVDREVTTLVCFPFADLASIRTLESDVAGDHVHWVPGIDRELEGLVMHLLHDAPTVLVVVHSAALEPARLEAVLATFARQRTRNHRLCVATYDPADPEPFVREVEAAVDEMRERLGLPPAERLLAEPILAARRVSRPRREVEPRPAPAEDAQAERSEEFEVASFDLTTTNPGASESGTTFPDLTAAAENVRRGRLARAGNHRSRHGGAWVVPVAVASAVAAAAWIWMQPTPTVTDAVSTSKAHAPRRFTPGPAPKPEPKIVTPPAPIRTASAPGAAEARSVAAALDAGQIRALDALLVRSATWEPEPFADAKKRCAKLEVSGLPGWRLPTLEELRRLRRARLLPAGEYWSSSRVGGQSLFTLDRDVTRPQERSKDDIEHARPLCVHQRG